MADPEQPKTGYERWEAPKIEESVPEGGQERPEASASREAREAKLEERRTDLEELAQDENAPKDSSAIDQKVKRYLQEHLPDYLQREPGGVSKISSDLLKWRQQRREKKGYTVKGREHLPDGPAMFVGNHPEVIGMNEPVFGELADRDVHAVLSADIHWDGPAIKQWFLKRLGHISVETTLSQYSEQEREEIVQNQPRGMRKKYQTIADRESSPQHRDFIRESVAALISGGDLLIYPEGEWARYPGKEKELRPAQSGFAAIAREYERVTGDSLPIVSIATSEEGMSFGKEYTLHDVPEGMDVSDYAMGRVGAMLPEDMRGVYADQAKKLEGTEL